MRYAGYITHISSSKQSITVVCTL